jgi:hypothetical protein
MGDEAADTFLFDDIPQQGEDLAEGFGFLFGNHDDSP